MPLAPTGDSSLDYEAATTSDDSEFDTERLILKSKFAQWFSPYYQRNRASIAIANIFHFAILIFVRTSSLAKTAGPKPYQS
jgi:hypothetical protein